MSPLNTRVAASVCFFFLASGFVSAQVIGGDRSYTIEDGAITLNGTFDQLAGIEAVSVGQFLGLRTATIAPGVEIQLRDPFPNSATILTSGPDTVVIGVLGADNRIDISGSTATAILYSESLDVAAGGDLTVNLGLGNNSPAQLLPLGGNTGGGEDPTFYASIVDGYLALHGSFRRAGALYARSTADSLSVEDAKLPFGTEAFVETNTPQEIKFGVIDSSDRISFEGQTITSVAYSGSDPVSDLRVEIGMDECRTRPFTLPIGEENALHEVLCNFTDAATSFTPIGGVHGNGTLGGDGLYATVFDGRLVLNGTFNDVAGIETTSISRRLGLAFGSRAPFDAAEVVTSRNNRVSLGVLNSANRITAEGITETAIEYSGSIRTAKLDLSVDLRTAECGWGLASLPVGIEAAVDQLVCDSGTTGATNRLPDFVQIVDGAVTIQGAFDLVREIEATSVGGHLSIDTEEIDGELVVFNLPFNRADRMSIFASPTRVELGVLEAEDRINIEGETLTSILYSEAPDIAAIDLNVSIDSSGFDGGGGDGTGGDGGGGLQYFSVVDGRIHFHGTFNQLAGIEVISAGGFLALDSIDVPGVGPIDLKEPFSNDASVVANTADTIVLGVLGADRRITISGQTPTSIIYNGPLDLLNSDLTINLGLGDGGVRLLAFPVVPEPDSGMLLLFGIVAMAWRRRRHPRRNHAKRNLRLNISNKYIAVAVLFLIVPSTAVWAQDGDRKFASLIDGHITINGTFNDVVAVQAASTGGHLLLDSIEVAEGGSFFLTDPFPAGALVVANEPDGRLVTLGVLGTEQRINIEGVTQTAISYSQPLSTALSDLGVDIGLGVCGTVPATLPIGVDAGIDELICDGGTSMQKIGNTGVVPRHQYFASIVDGHLALNGNVANVGGLFVRSNSDALSLQAAQLPFAAGVLVETNTPSEIKFGVSSVDNRISWEGQTLTSIAYSGTDESATSDLQVKLGLQSCGSRPGSLPVAPNSARRISCDFTDPVTEFSPIGGIREPLYAALVDGHVTISGTFPRVGGIFVHSSGAALSLEDALLPFGVDAFVTSNTAQEVKFGVAESPRRINFEGQTITSIAYGGSEADARNDLTIELGLDQCRTAPMTLTIGEENAVRQIQCNSTDPATTFTSLGGVPGNGTVGGEGIYATVFDGHVVFNGTINNLSGIEAASSARHLSLDLPNRTAPFPAAAQITENNSRRISLGVLSSADRISVEGITQTSIEYARTIRTATSDLAIDLRLEECGSELASVPIGVDSAVDQLVCGSGTIPVADSLPDFAQIVDGVLTIQGKFDRVREIEATSRGGNLSLDSVDRNGAVAIFKKPFSQADQVSIFSSPHRVRLGVLDSDDRVNIEGDTRTSILYSESPDIAATDLSVRIDHLPIPDENPDPIDIPGDVAVSLVDGHITLSGTFNQLAGIQALSTAGFLSLDTIDIPGVGPIAFVLPFQPSYGIIVANTPNEVVLGVLGTDNRIDISGDTQTSILYSGPADQFFDDVTINLGLGDNPPVTLPFVPEPSSGALMLFALAGLILRRRSRPS